MVNPTEAVTWPINSQRDTPPTSWLFHWVYTWRTRVESNITELAHPIHVAYLTDYEAKRRVRTDDPVLMCGP